jgi:hypothetical protein
MEWLIGHTGYSFLDVWAIVHTAFWIFTGSCLWAMKVHRTNALLFCMSLALTWEVGEYFLSRKFTEIWLNPESWWNSWISDPLTCLVGVVFIFWALDRWGKKQQ